jgi:AcrR family transcriptional regulator
MRITRKAQEENRGKILAVAAALFAEKGYEQTTTRDIAGACAMAAGTLFNYFPTKETLAMTMVAGAMEAGRQAFCRRRSGSEDLQEEMFLLLTSELRALRPFRPYIGPVLESCMSVFSKSTVCPAGEGARKAHLQTVRQILARHGYELIPHSVTVTLYWSLYLGILAHWSHDDSRNQEETLALADYSMRLFARTVRGDLDTPEEDR